MCRDCIAEGLDGQQSDLFEEIGVHTDEAAGVSIKDLEGLMPGKGGGGGGTLVGKKRPIGSA